MKPRSNSFFTSKSRSNPILRHTAIATSLALTFTNLAFSDDLYLDSNGSAANIGGPGVWNTANTWRLGSDTGTLQNWVDGNTAIFGGPTPTVSLYVEVPTNIIVSQLKFISGGNGFFYNIGRNAANTANTAGTLTFNGSYDSTTPSIDASALAVAGSVSISSKITGTITGGLVIKASSNMSAGYSNTTVGRIYLRSDSGNDFTGDVTVLSGSLDARSLLGNANNKLILAGGGLISLTDATANNATTTYSVARDIEVTASSAIGSWAGSAGTNRTVVVDLASGKNISGSGNLTRYLSSTSIGSGNKEEVRLSGSMSGYTGTFENVGGVTVIQTTSTSGGAWKLTGGTIKLNTTNDTHIADGSGKSDLIMNGGTLDMNGKSEIINGLSGLTGTVQNQLASTTSTLTLGAGDATASFGGVIKNNTTSGGTLALTKIGTGAQTLGGTNLYTGATNVNAGKLIVNGSTASASAVTVAAGTASGISVATLGGNGTIGGNVTLTAESSAGFKNGGVLAPTAAASGTKLSVTGTTTIGTGSIFEWNMSATAPATDPGNGALNSGSYGQLAGTGTISGGDAAFRIVLGAGNAFTDAFWNSDKTWDNVFTGDGATNSLASIFSSISGSGITFASNKGTVIDQGYFTFSGTSTLSWTAVPEPTSALAGLLLTAGLLRRRRRA